VKNYARDDDKNNAILVNIGDLKSKQYKDHVTRMFHQGYTTSEPYYMIVSKPRNKHMTDYGPLQSSYYITGNLEMIYNKHYQKLLGEKKWNKDIPVYKMISKTGEVLLSFTHKMAFNEEERFVNKDNYFSNQYKNAKVVHIEIGSSAKNTKCVKVSNKIT